MSSLLELLIFRGWLETEQADALAPCGGASVFGTYRDTILYLFMRLENEAPHAFATWVPCTPRIIPPLDDAQACSNTKYVAIEANIMSLAMPCRLRAERDKCKTKF